MYRRSFLKSMGIAGTYLTIGAVPEELFVKPEFSRLTILHTNDVPSRVEPFPMDGSRNQGLGGAARRSSLISRIRQDEPQVLLFDSGDIFQGTPYFNVYGGEIEFKLMSEMHYDAATIGNHDFDAGIDGLVKQLPHASFPFVISNYDFSDTVMHDHALPYKVFSFEDIRVGVTGVGIELSGLVPKNLYKETRYLDPVQNANAAADHLKNNEGCDYVVCLSHLGYKYRYGKVSDIDLARGSRNIDLILGGHTHTFLDEPDIQKNLDGLPVVINQVGWGGMKLGHIEVFFEKNRKNHCTTCTGHWIS